MLDRHHCTTIFHLYDYIWFGLYHHRVLQVAFHRSFPHHSEDHRPIVRPCWRNSPRNHVRLMVLQNPYTCILDRWLGTWLPFLLSMLNPYIWHCRGFQGHFYISKRTFLEDYLYKPNLHLNKIYKLSKYHWNSKWKMIPARYLTCPIFGQFGRFSAYIFYLERLEEDILGIDLYAISLQHFLRFLLTRHPRLDNWHHRKNRPGRHKTRPTGPRKRAFDVLNLFSPNPSPRSEPPGRVGGHTSLVLRISQKYGTVLHLQGQKLKCSEDSFRFWFDFIWCAEPYAGRKRIIYRE